MHVPCAHEQRVARLDGHACAGRGMFQVIARDRVVVVEVVDVVETLRSLDAAAS